MASTLTTNFAHFQIPLEDVQRATDNFHHDNLITKGGSGSAYSGQLLVSRNLMKIVALRLDRKLGVRDIEFWNEISMLSDLKHTNLVSFIGFCDEKNEKIIVIRQVANGSLVKHLNGPNLTSWARRLRISIGVARALSYLHHDDERSYGVIHRNINSFTILLDENWEPKLSGFTFSIKQPVNRMDQVVPCEPIGISGYMDPEIEKIKGASSKSDIYSFGVVLFEILCGRTAYIQNEANMFLAPLAKDHYENKTLQDIIQSDLWNQMSPFSLVKYSETAYSCLKEEGERRPRIEYVVAQLEKALELQLQRENIVRPRSLYCIFFFKSNTTLFPSYCYY
ncbi:putative protein kinase RLK-Pelle-CrRLK1L-1 family [Helianthus annuus]|nr:putative protein kinase RLK-Pelle-CrRLK1L-1 family [Helianthus annuus]